eukprot:TRINITY_DN13133_c0_g1_i1.p1 TRINITY_DN13133_c0_g1~~TRINITY_DN13133_c0_g1_i1.p1  ORF type:complete len:285 (-),score=55.73 TRINITY_DN13133_c0_g1_i1:89-943(-)
MRYYQPEPTGGHNYVQSIDYFEDETKKNLALDEYWNEIQRTVHHPNVYVPVRCFRHKDLLYILHESIVANNYFGYLMDNSFGELSEKKLARIVKDMLLGVKYLSEQGLYLFTAQQLNMIYDAKGDWIEFKLFDFGFRSIGRSPLEGVELQAPEQHRLTDVQSSAAMENIWAIGMYLYWLLAGNHPYSEERYAARQYLRMANEGVVFPVEDEAVQELSADVKDFVSKLYKIMPEDRMSIDDALNHPWIRDPPNRSLEMTQEWCRESYSSFMRGHPFLIFDDLLED